jgi:hypothetical protein
MEKNFSTFTSDKDLITIIYKELKKVNSPKLYDPMNKWANEVKRAFSKEEVQMAKNT